MLRKLPPSWWDRWTPSKTLGFALFIVLFIVPFLVLTPASTAQEGEPAAVPAAAPEGEDQDGEATSDTASTDGSENPDGEGDEGATDAERSGNNIFTPIQRFLRPGQSHLMELEEGPGWLSALLIGIGLVVAYLGVISIVLFVWRRARKPSFWKHKLEEIEGEGRWQCQVAYDIRRKVDAMLELKINQVEPGDASPQLACLVGDTIKGRLGTGSSVKIGFPHLRPRNFWQGEHLERISIGFELIQPRDRKVLIHLDCRVEYAIRRRKSTGGIFEAVLEFEPTADTLGRLLTHQGLIEGNDEEHGEIGDLPSRPASIDDTAAVRVLAADLSGWAAQETSPDSAIDPRSELEDLRRNLEIHDQRLQLLEGEDHDLPGGGAGLDPLRREIAASEERLLSKLEGRLAQTGGGSGNKEIESIWRELQSLEQRLTQAVGDRLQKMDDRLASMPSPADGTLLQRAIDDLEQRLTADIRRLGQLSESGEGDSAATGLRSEMQSLEQRLVSDMRENIQVLASGLQGLRTQLTGLNASVNDLMQRFVNIERRIAQHEQRIERLGG